MLTSATVSPEGGEKTDTLSEKPESIRKKAEDDIEDVSWRGGGSKESNMLRCEKTIWRTAYWFFLCVCVCV